MKVVIMYRNSYDGGDGWRYFPMTVTIGDNCPVCQGKRGIPKPYHFCEDGEWFDVETWNNPCGHIDKYGDCYRESKKIAEENKILEPIKTSPF